MSGVIRLKESNCKVTDAKPHKTGSTTDASVKVMNYIIWYSVQIIRTVTHLVQTVSSQGFISMVRNKKCIKACYLITTVYTLIININ